MGSIINPKPYKFKKYDGLLSKLLSTPKSRLYQQLKSAKHFDEIRLQNVLIIKFKELLPSYGIIYYDKVISSRKSPYENKKPDFLLWKSDYSEWYIIEVELDNHGEKHIKDQLDAFYNGDYSKTNEIATYVHSKDSKVDIIKFEGMLLTYRPRIMLIADRIDCTWRNAFNLYSCLFATLQVYSDEENHLLYRISGDFPQEYTRYTYANIDKYGPSLIVDSKFFFDNIGINDGDIVNIYYQGDSEEWKYVVDSKGNASLLFNGDFLSIDVMQKTWKIIQNTKNQIHIIK